MPTLYVANASKQNHDFIYRLPEETSFRRQQIPRGGQIVIYQANINADIVSIILDQHLRYGLVDSSKIDSTKPFVGLCYSIDKPINVNKIMYADEHNAGVLQNQSEEARKLSAAAIHDAINASTDGAVRVERLDFEVVEQNKPSEPGLNEIVSVSRQGSSESDSKSAKPRKRR